MGGATVSSINLGDSSYFPSPFQSQTSATFDFPVQFINTGGYL